MDWVKWAAEKRKPTVHSDVMSLWSIHETAVLVLVLRAGRLARHKDGALWRIQHGRHPSAPIDFFPRRVPLFRPALFDVVALFSPAQASPVSLFSRQQPPARDKTFVRFELKKKTIFFFNGNLLDLQVAITADLLTKLKFVESNCLSPLAQNHRGTLPAEERRKDSNTLNWLRRASTVLGETRRILVRLSSFQIDAICWAKSRVNVVKRFFFFFFLCQW